MSKRLENGEKAAKMGEILEKCQSSKKTKNCQKQQNKWVKATKMAKNAVKTDENGKKIPLKIVRK